MVARTRTPLDPVVHVYKYFVAAGIKPSSDEFIFRAIKVDKSGKPIALRRAPRPISYTTAREMLRKLLADIGLNPSLYGTHSLRAGGATAAAQHDVPERLFKKHGPWRSDDSKDRYIKESMEKRLRVSLNLGL